ncbi:Retrovirus-related Pol polyprotein from transposon 17.6 [Mytilus coruscus]|uniref:Retrovirus-related Pol polyprotein from transposon 17.6 n=1 Tax=Mytilus coruscus TaxID=42192 RepID=A0A6J8A474_MYTCO|nr:Retrovirus-related Pol polyprotein from transposon 17.6 [Mytilus coruscus]
MTQHFSYSIPDLQDLTESFSNKTPNFLTSIDLSSGFFQLPISKESQRYTACNTCFGTFKFSRLPMGLSSSPASFQLLMNKVLKGLTFKLCLCYLDDILVAFETFDQHIEDLRNVFPRLSNAGLKLGPKKCTFVQNSCIYLGHKISNKGIEPPPDRVQAIVE